MALTTVPGRELGWLEALRPGDGAGADVTNIALLQTRFLDSQCGFPPSCQGPCNVVLLLWDESQENPDGVDVFLNGRRLGTVPGMPRDRIPGTNGVNLEGLPAGPQRVRAEAVHNRASFVEETIEVLDSQPFSDAMDLSCREGALEANGTCQVELDWATAGALPDAWGILFGENAPDRPLRFLGTVSGNTLRLTITGVAPGEHCVEVVGIRSSP
ncbi:MAG: hypothetical protein HY721_19745, partial [Planctomycetes bacterium]|nr:hypothetical protein [Planctomycetota bacterium]